jgi:hypothetical protein
MHAQIHGLQITVSILPHGLRLIDGANDSHQLMMRVP